MSFISKLPQYYKALVALTPLLLSVIADVAGADSPWYQKLVAALAALGVYAVPNAMPVE